MPPAIIVARYISHWDPPPPPLSFLLFFSSNNLPYCDKASSRTYNHQHKNKKHIDPSPKSHTTKKWLLVRAPLAPAAKVTVPSVDARAAA